MTRIRVRSIKIRLYGFGQKHFIAKNCKYLVYKFFFDLYEAMQSTSRTYDIAFQNMIFFFFFVLGLYPDPQHRKRRYGTVAKREKKI
jgi:hypothetical protein